MKKSIRELALEYYMERPGQPLKHGEVVDWVTEQYRKENPTPPRDPWRTIRSLYQKGYLVKVGKGSYMYDPDHIANPELEDFTTEQKETIFKRDSYRCVICGRGRAEGIEIHADHIKPKQLGGKAEIENGQTLCAQHNLKKKMYGQTETGKKMFIRLYELAKKNGDHELLKFCEEVLSVFESNNMNGHIEWKR